jgi:hypothetical protein
MTISKFFNSMKSFFDSKKLNISINCFLFIIIALVSACSTCTKDYMFVALLSTANATCIYALSRRLKLSNTISYIVCLSWIIRLLCLQNLNVEAISNDGNHHQIYLNKILEKGYILIPKSFECYLCYHPPLYYIFSALISKLLTFIIGIRGQYHSVFSLLCSLISSYYAYLLFRLIWLEKRLKLNLLTRKICLLLSISLFIFWPLSIANSIKIGNDNLLNLLYIMGLFYLLKWSKYDDNKSLFLSSIIASLALWTKTTGLVLMLLIVLSVIVCQFFHMKKLNKKNEACN